MIKLIVNGFIIAIYVLFFNSCNSLAETPIIDSSQDQISETSLVTSTSTLEISELDPLPTLKSTDVAAIKPTPTVTLTKFPSETAYLIATDDPVDYPLPDIVINTRNALNYFCAFNTTRQVWYLKYPYSAPEFVLGDDEYNYLYPTWSPDGKWIAYFRSKYQETGEGARSDHSTGGDQLWLIRPDGNDERPISPELPNDLYRWADGCQLIGYVAGSLSWSPNSKYIIFMQYNLVDGKYEPTYYLTNVETGATSKLLTQSRTSEPHWLNDDKVAFVTDNKEIFLISVEGQSVKTEYLPINIDNDENLNYLIVDTYGEDNTTLAIVDYELVRENELAIGKPLFHDLWEVDTKTGNWDKKLTIERLFFSFPLLRNDFGIACESKDNLEIFGLADWETIHKVPFSGALDCSTYQFLLDNEGDEVISIIGYSMNESGKDVESIYTINPFATEPRIELLINISELFPDTILDVLEYNWRPKQN